MNAFYYNHCHGNALKWFWSLRYTIYECMCCYNHCYDSAVKGFWALLDHIYDVYIVIAVTMAAMLRSFGLYSIIFINSRVITIVMIVLLRDCKPMG
jgi:hypothetical protein